MRAKFSGASHDWKTRNMLITFEALEPVDIMKLADMGELNVTVKEWRNHRSLDANAYYWVLLSKLAEALRVSKPRMHNLILRRYGQILTVDGQKMIVMLPDTEKAEETALEASTYHLRPTSQVRKGNPVDFRAYVLLRGSSDYDTREMSVLLDGLIDECKQAGIETATPEEIARMKELYERNHPARERVLPLPDAPKRP